MQSLWNDAEAAALQCDPKAIRVYTSRLLGQNPDLVLHGGGNTSVKLRERDFFGQEVDLLFVKGSGWDLASIEIAGFTPLRMDALLKLVQLPTLTDSEMVAQQRVATVDAQAPSASVEAILHAIIPHRFVDHTHADAIIAITNTPDGQRRIEELYGDQVLVIPYVMPGFVLARKVFEQTRSMDWSGYRGMVLMQHGLFTFDDDPRLSYEATIDLVSQAESYLESRGANRFVQVSAISDPKLATPISESSGLKLAELRRAVSVLRGRPVIARWNRSPALVAYSSLSNIAELGTRGPVTPDHSIRTKRIPLVLNQDLEQSVQRFAEEYRQYFQDHQKPGMACLDAAPRWAIWPGCGIVSLGANAAEAQIIDDIATHTAKVVRQAEAIAGWQALPPQDVFEVEYWELEQAKLKKQSLAPPLQGKIALVTGAANGIGRECAQQLHQAGAAVVAVDINESVAHTFDSPDRIGVVCDVNQRHQLQAAVSAAISSFGGLDIVVSNAGVFSQGQNICELSDQQWDRSLQLNLTQHKNLMQLCYPYLRFGLEPTLIVVGSKNVAAPGPGAAAYSVAKAGLNQLMRVAALEWGHDSIRVNIIHPDCVYDTQLWSGTVLQERAAHYGMTVEQYQTRSVLRQSVTSKEVGLLVVTLAGAPFLKTTGAQIPIDGGNQRVI